MTYRIDVKIDTDAYDAIIEAAREAPAIMTGFVDNLVADTRRKLQTEYIKEPPRVPALPFVWSTDPVKQARARRWYFANKVPRGSRGGRYKRTGRLIASWNLKTIRGSNSTVIQLEHPDDRVAYVMGERQVPSHRETGWTNIAEVIPKINAEITERTIDAWFAFTDPFGGAI